MITIVLVPGTQNLYVKSWCDKVKRDFHCHIHKSWIKIFVICISTSKLLSTCNIIKYHTPKFGKVVIFLLLTHIWDLGNLTIIMVMMIVWLSLRMHLPKHGGMKIAMKKVVSDLCVKSCFETLIGLVCHLQRW